MGKRICSVEGCERQAASRGWCDLHYGRWRRQGDPMLVVRPRAEKYATDGERKAAESRAKQAWRLRNPEKMSAARMQWEKENPERRKWYRRQRKKLDPVANRAYVSARRARLKDQAHVPFTAEQLRQRWAYFGDLCWMCRNAPGEVIEHVKPICKGGGHILCNIRPACHHCNTKKGTKWPFPTSIKEGRDALQASLPPMHPDAELAGIDH